MEDGGSNLVPPLANLVKTGVYEVKIRIMLLYIRENFISLFSKCH